MNRRDFLRLFGLSAAGLAIEPVRKLWFVPSNAPVGSRVERLRDWGQLPRFPDPSLKAQKADAIASGGLYPGQPERTYGVDWTAYAEARVRQLRERGEDSERLRYYVRWLQAERAAFDLAVYGNSWVLAG